MNQEMEYVYQVYQERNFTKAAEKLYISQPALSMAIKKVEDGLGMPIFDRSTRPLSLTAAGEAYIRHIRETMDLEKDLEQQLQDIRSLNTGHICVGGSHYLNAYILPPILAGFSRRYPNIVVDIKEASSADLSEMLSNRQLDLTFNCNPRFMEGFERYKAFRDHVLLGVPKSMEVPEEAKGCELTSKDVAAGRHLEEDCPTVNLSAFRDMEFILLARGNHLRTLSEEMFAEAGFQPKVRMELSQLVTARYMADAGIAATFVSDRLISNRWGELRYYKLNSQVNERQFYILLPSKKYTSMAVRAFIRYFREQVQ